jgi:hypothetical protein
MYAPICELRRNSTILPLRSRTSWRLRALTVTCLPRDWTRAGVNHLANNPRRRHNLPEGQPRRARGKVWATGHARQSQAQRTSGPRQGHQDPSGPSGPAGPWDAAGTVSHLMALIHRRQHRDELRVRHQGSQNRTTLHQLPQTPGNGDFLPTFLPRRQRSGVELYLVRAAWAVQRRRPRIAAGSALAAAGSVARLRATAAEPLR